MSSQSAGQEATRRNIESIAKMEAEAIDSRTRGERFADRVAGWVGSWTFLVVQSTLALLWISINLLDQSGIWDPFPFSLLNLVLSFQAAFSTPVILMSENRQARLSERRNHLDLQINLLAEQENTEQLRLLRLLCEKAGIQTVEPERNPFDQPADPSEITRQIVESVESKHLRK
jgi:uncharacterized membrane protein